ncbi:hypothetical protein ACRYCC_42930 [Actinomadura scrupuli]|uniref:hypothetical protein n=1 Tax=Actinomadura scrupuli TaxID=559629 RepID=UPI003D962259
MDALSINTIRGLCLDAIQQAESGHPGTPMDIAPVAYMLWQRFLRFDPSDPIWPNRDRFVLSEGHASTLLWSLLHLTGVRAVNSDYEVLGRPAVTLEDLKTFRRTGGSWTPTSDTTLEAFYDHGQVDAGMPADGGDADEVLARFTEAGVDVAALANKLQRDDAKAFVTAWNDLMTCVSTQSASLV